MTAAPLLEHLQHDPARFEELARALVEAAMIENAALERLGPVMYPAHGYPDKKPDADARRRSDAVFAAWYAWIGQAEALLHRLRQAPAAGESQRLPDYAEAFDLQVRLARSKVHLTLNDLLFGFDQALRGEGIPLEEVRRELQSKLRAKRASQVEAA